MNLSLYTALLRPFLFRMDPESAHHLVLNLARTAEGMGLHSLLTGMLGPSTNPGLEKKLFGLRFRGPLGLAAGFDKDCSCPRFLAALGFSHIELGTVTAKAQPGNPRPRIFRLPKDRALINRMGFPSCGADVFAEKLQRLREHDFPAILGVNIGKSKEAELDQALSDYQYTFRLVHEYADYVAINVSSPNTPGLRELQKKERLRDLLNGLQDINSGAKPLLVKVAPDLEYTELDEVLECCIESGIAGLIATNTTFSRKGLCTASESVAAEQGGLSGPPVHERALEFVRYISKVTERKLPLIGVGGISSGKEAFSFLQAGASLVQAYTGFVYGGPTFVREIHSELSRFICTSQIDVVDSEADRSEVLPFL